MAIANSFRGRREARVPVDGSFDVTYGPKIVWTPSHNKKKGEWSPPVGITEEACRTANDAADCEATKHLKNHLRESDDYLQEKCEAVRWAGAQLVELARVSRLYQQKSEEVNKKVDERRGPFNRKRANAIAGHALSTLKVKRLKTHDAGRKTTDVAFKRSIARQRADEATAKKLRAHPKRFCRNNFFPLVDLGSELGKLRATNIIGMTG